MEEANSIPISENIENDSVFLARSEIVDHVRRFGGCTSDAVLDPKMSQFTHPGVEGFIGFRQAFRCAVILGDPVCALEQREALTRAFHEFAKERNWSIIYIAVSRSFAEWGAQNICSSLIEFGEELIYDPREDPRKRPGTNGSLVRRKVKRAIKEEVVISEFRGADRVTQEAMEDLGIKWLRARKGPQIHISNIYLFDDSHGKRWFIAKLKGEVVGSISLNQIQAHAGWLMNHLMVLPDAPIGTSELLFTTVLETLDQEGCRFATVGIVTAKELGEIRGLSRGAQWLARNIFRAARRVYDLDGLHMFWGKFHPDKQPVYILSSKKGVGLRELLSISRAMNGPI